MAETLIATTTTSTTEAKAKVTTTTSMAATTPTTIVSTMSDEEEEAHQRQPLLLHIKLEIPLYTIQGPRHHRTGLRPPGLHSFGVLSQRVLRSL
jgi:hypothetical protein